MDQMTYRLYRKNRSKSAKRCRCTPVDVARLRVSGPPEAHCSKCLGSGVIPPYERVKGPALAFNSECIKRTIAFQEFGIVDAPDTVVLWRSGDGPSIRPEDVLIDTQGSIWKVLCTEEKRIMREYKLKVDARSVCAFESLCRGKFRY